MAKLYIKSHLRSVVIVGEFCKWDPEKGIRAERETRNKLICVDDMPAGEYRVLTTRSYHGGEIYPTDGREMGNRYFSGVENEKIFCYFK